MWINFTSFEPCIIKIYAGGINVISGERHDENIATKFRQSTKLAEKESPQDYIVTGQQPWLDGFVHLDGQVRQFVAMPVNSGYSVEAQLTGEDNIGGLHFEVTPLKRAPLHPQGPRTIGNSSGALLPGEIEVFIKTFDGSNLTARVFPTQTATRIKTMIYQSEGVKPEDQRLVFAGKQLEEGVHILSRIMLEDC